MSRCRKVPHACEADAQRVADRINARDNFDGAGENTPYLCEQCGAWHIGRAEKQRTPIRWPPKLKADHYQ